MATMEAAMVALASSKKLSALAITIKVLHYVYPALVFFAFIFALALTVCTVQTRSLRVKDQHVRRDIIFGILIAVVCTYFAEAIVVLVNSSAKPPLAPTQDRVVYLIASVLIFGLQILVLFDAKFPVWYPYYSTWFLGIAGEFTLLITGNIAAHPKTPSGFVVIGIQILRIIGFILLPTLYFQIRNSKNRYGNDDAERQSLLAKKLAPKPSDSENSNGYGGTDSTDQQTETGDDAASDAGSEDSWLETQRKAQDLIQKRLENDGNWWTYAKGFSIFFPLIWPLHDNVLQFRAVLVGVCLLATNAFNVLVPRQLGIMIDTLTKYASGEDRNVNIWLPVITYTVLLFISGGACIGWLRKWLWLPLEQYSYDALSTASHAHIMSLSSDFHDSKTSSDLSQAIAGGRSVSDLLDTVCFQVLPMFIDLSVAFAYLWSLFGPYMGFIMATTTITYLYVTTKMVASRAEKRREFITVYRKEWTVGQQSLDGWTTASLFNMIPYERKRYQSAVKDHMQSKRIYELSTQASGAAQGLVMTFGLLGALYLAVYQVVNGEKTVGQFATLLSYWAQLQGPLVFFSTVYRSISYSLMDAERLLELFQTKPSIKDIPNAKPIKFSKGKVEFDQVSFAYDDRRPTLKNVSFVVPSGKTVALVGETGGGKSTLLKLIDRFYDVKAGSIRIDGQDLRDVTLSSLREKIGVVPQDPMLFNDSIMNNVRYARQNASDKEVYEACKAAAVHDKIMSFPDGYNSKVGDRGVKVSGGEKQRIAIARAILKQPEIILLDEATSAVDTETEQMIQEGLKALCTDRTTFIVAHRLSTIMRADHILVVMNGEIAEQGHHKDLLASKGKYYDLWTKQIFLRPSDRSRSRSPKKQQGDIVNDLGADQHKAEIKKADVQNKANQLQAKKDAAISNTDSTKYEGGGHKDGGHKKEGSKLRPDVPAFVPRLSESSETVHTCKEHSKKEKSPKKPDKHPKRSTIATDDTLQSTAEESSSAGPSKGQVTDGEADGFEKPKAKRSRYGRRNQAKSEPSSRAQYSTDGAQDSEMTAGSSGEGIATTENSSAQRRRVSAPSEPPVEGRTTRSRRNRHWRLKNRAAENGSSTLGTSGEGSLDGSHETQNTTVHNTTPVESAAASTSANVRFAPGF